jgi:ribosome-associated heat shock protein Hsp15
VAVEHNGPDESDDDDDGDGGAGAGATTLRIDRWLWCARFYKSRSLAAAAVSAGRVRLAGTRVKPARALKLGDTLSVAWHGRDLELVVRALPARRGPPAEAAACYEESAASRARGLDWQNQRRLAALTVPRPERRPDKKERRELAALARRQGRE